MSDHRQDPSGLLWGQGEGVDNLSWGTEIPFFFNLMRYDLVCVWELLQLVYLPLVKRGAKAILNA